MRAPSCLMWVAMDGPDHGGLWDYCDIVLFNHRAHGSCVLSLEPAWIVVPEGISYCSPSNKAEGVIIVHVEPVVSVLSR
jgi:hypothetical protein